MSMVSQLSDFINAAFSGLWIQTVEPEEAERELIDMSVRKGWSLAVWDIARGLKMPDPGAYDGERGVWRRCCGGGY